MPEICSDCGASFPSAPDRGEHRRRAHPGTPGGSLDPGPPHAFPCVLCGTHFPTAADLARHVLETPHPPGHSSAQRSLVPH